MGDVILQVGPAEVAHEHRRIAKPKLNGDILANGFGCGRRIGVDRRIGKAVAQPSQFAILGTEVMSPGADAVCFIDCKEGDVLVLQELERSRRDQSFRRHIQQAQLAGFDLLGDLSLFVDRERAVHRRGRNAARGERIDLVLHEREQRRHDDGQPVAAHGRRLEAERLAAAGGHDDQRIAIVHHALHRLALERQVIVEAPVGLQRLQQRVVLRLASRPRGFIERRPG